MENFLIYFDNRCLLSDLIWVIKLIFSRIDLIVACMSYYWEVEPNMEWNFILNTGKSIKNV